MSKGLGTLQRKIIEAGGATKTIWQCGIPLPVDTAHDEKKEAHGINVDRETGSKWRSDGKPCFKPYTFTTVETPQRLAQLRASFRMADFCFNGFKEEDFAHILPACISMPHIRCLIFPELWSLDIGNEARHDSLGRFVMRVPEKIAIGRNIANASISRAISSMVKRGLVEWSSITNERCPSLMNRWKHYDRGRVRLFGGPNTYEWHNILVVLDSRATFPGDNITPSNA
jgi:hypothetical protein